MLARWLALTAIFSQTRLDIFLVHGEVSAIEVGYKRDLEDGPSLTSADKDHRPKRFACPIWTNKSHVPYQQQGLAPHAVGNALSFTDLPKSPDTVTVLDINLTPAAAPLPVWAPSLLKQQGQLQTQPPSNGRMFRSIPSLFEELDLAWAPHMAPPVLRRRKRSAKSRSEEITASEGTKLKPKPDVEKATADVKIANEAVKGAAEAVKGAKKVLTEQGYSHFVFQLIDHQDPIQNTFLSIDELRNTFLSIDELRLELYMAQRKAKAASKALQSAKAANRDEVFVQISVKGLDNKSVGLDVELANSVAKMKARLCAKTGIPAAQQNLTFEGKPLEDGRLLSEYNIRKASNVHMADRLRRGTGGPSFQITTDHVAQPAAAVAAQPAAAAAAQPAAAVAQPPAQPAQVCCDHCYKKR